FQAEDGIRDFHVTGVQTCALPILNCRIPINVNGVDYVIGEDIPDWYPFFVNPSHHFFDCGTFSFGTSNTITVGVTQDSAQIMGLDRKSVRVGKECGVRW